MPGVPILDRVVSIHRMSNNPLGGQPGQPREKVVQVYSGIRAGIVPISSFTAEMPFARESTHVVWVEYWLNLLLEDEIWHGRRDTNDYGDPVRPQRYIINGRRTFTGIGPRLPSYYAKVQE